MMQYSKPTFVVLSLLSALGVAACGPAAEPGEGEEGDDSSSVTDPTNGPTSNPTDPTVDPTDTDPIPFSCNYEGQEYQSGEEFTTADGCATYQCDNGTLVMIDDSFTVVEGDLDLPDQATVDGLECLREVTGALTISGSVTDLTALTTLYRVGGNLTITASDLVSLAGVGGIGEVGGSIVISDNAQLTTLAFGSYMSVFGDTTIQNNDALVSLSGAGFLGQCGGCVRGPGAGLGEGEATTGGSEPDPGGDVGGEDGSATAGDEPGGGTYYGNILIADNDVLTDVSALGNLWFAWADLRLRGNIALVDLTPMSQLSEVRGALEISGHPAMDDATVQAFAAAVDVWGERIVCGNGAGTPC